MSRTISAHEDEACNEQVSEPAEALLRIGEENGLPDRTIVSLQERLPAIREDHDQVNMFDIVNLVTNQANAADVRNRRGQARNLEAVGGDIVTAHAERCSLCHSKLSH